MTKSNRPTPRTDAAMWSGYDGPVVVDAEFARTLEREIQRLQQALKAERDSFIQLAVRTLGQEGYDNSPCQAHPGELVEAEIERLRGDLSMVRAKLTRIAAEAVRALESILHARRHPTSQYTDMSRAGMRTLAGETLDRIKTMGWEP